MGLLKTKSVREVSVSRSRLVKGNFQEIICAAQESLAEFKNYVGKICALFGERFLFFKQDVWYDSLTNLLLPKFDKSFCKSIALEEFSALIDGKNKEDFFLTFAGFKGRCISAEECREIFTGKANHYPHAPGNRRPRFFIDGKEVTAGCLYTQLSWTTKNFGADKARNIFSVAAVTEKNCSIL